MAGIEDLVAQAYAGIGRSDTGEGLAAVTQGEKDYWAGQVASGAISPDNFQSAFNAAVNEYKTANPDDPYTQYVNSYQAQQSAPSSSETATTTPAASSLQTNVDNWFAANPNATSTDVASAVQSIGGLTPELSAILANKYGTDLNTIQTTYDNYVKDKTYDDLVTSAYGDIGRTGIGSLTSNIDQGGIDYWKGQLASGAISQDDFKNVFNNAVREYKAANPDDDYTQYVNNYQLGQQTDAMKTGIASLLSDNKITLDEANEIQRYVDNYGFNAADIARVTGRPIDTINQVLGARSNILGQGYAASSGDVLGLADYALTNKLSAKDLASASGGALTEDDAQTLITKAGTTAGRLELSNPEGYNQINSIIGRAVDKDYGGKPSDWMYKMFTGLSADELSQAPKQLELTAPRKETRVVGGDEGGIQTEEVTIPGTIKDTSGLIVLESDQDGNPTKYGKEVNSKDFNVKPGEQTHTGTRGLMAEYDANGTLTGYSSGNRIHVSDPQWIGASWDATGKATPISGVNQSGGFIKGLGNDVAAITQSLGPVWTAMKIANPALALVDVATDVARSEVGVNTAINAAQGYAGLEGMNAADLSNPSSVNYMSAGDMLSDGALASQSLQNAATAKTVGAGIAAADALDNENYGPALTLAANMAGVNQMPGVSASLNVVAGLDALAKGDTSSLLSAAGNLAGSSDLKLASAANKVINAIDSGNQAAIINAAAGFGDALKANDKTSGAVQTLKDLVSGAKTDVVNTLNKAGLTETTPDLTSTFTKQPTAEERSEAFSTIQNYQPKEGEMGVNIAMDPQLVAGEGYTGGLGGSPFKPGLNIDSRGQAFFAAFDESGNLLSRMPVVQEGGKIIAAYASDAPQLESALTRMGIKNATIPNEVMQALVKLNPSLGQTGFIPGSSAASADELAALLGKDILDMPSKTTAQTVSKLDSALAAFKGATKASPWSTLFDLATYSGDAGGPDEIAFEEAQKLQDLWRALQPKDLTVPIPKSDVGSPGPVVNVDADTTIAYDENNNPVTITDILEDIRKTPTFQQTYPEIKIDDKIKDRIDNKIKDEVVIDDKSKDKDKVVVNPPPPPPPLTDDKVKIDDKVIDVNPPPPPPPPPPVDDNPPPPPVDVVTPVTPVTPTNPVTPTKPTTPTTPTTTPAQSTGLNFGQVQQALAAAGIPQLANVFYYGKDFGGKKQKLDKRGELVDEEYNPLSVTKAGAAGEIEEQIAEEAKTKENDVNTALDHILGKSSESTSLDDLLNIVKGA